MQMRRKQQGNNYFAVHRTSVSNLHSSRSQGRHGQTSLHHCLIDGTRSHPREEISNGNCPKSVSDCGVHIKTLINIELVTSFRSETRNHT